MRKPQSMAASATSTSALTPALGSEAGDWSHVSLLSMPEAAELRESSGAQAHFRDTDRNQ